MTLHQLRIFEAVARFLNVTNAAKELHISQPAVSLQLKLLEEEFSAKFFERSNHGVELTSQGRAFLEAVRPALDQLDQLETDFKLRGRADKADSLAVGGNNTLTDMILPPVVIRFKARHPDVRLTLHTADSRTMESYVADAKVDLALITVPSHAPNCVYEPFGEYPVVAFVAKDSGITKPAMSLEELVRHPLVARRGNWIKEIVRRGLKLNFALECDSPQTVKSAVRRGLGVGILSRARVAFADDRGDFHLIELPELNNVMRKSYIIYAKHRPLTTLAQDFLATLRNVSGQMRQRPDEPLSGSATQSR